MSGRISAFFSLFWPRSIRSRALIVLAETLVVSQLIALGFYGYDRLTLERRVVDEDIKQKIELAQRVVAATPEGGLDQVLEALRSMDLLVRLAPVHNAFAPVMPPAHPPAAPGEPTAPQQHAPATPVPPAEPAAPIEPSNPVQPNIPGDTADLNRLVQENLAKTLSRFQALQSQTAAAAEAARIKQEHLERAAAAMQDQIENATDMLRGHLDEARMQMAEAQRRVDMARAELARQRDPDERQAAIDELRDAERDVADARREMARLGRDIQSRVVRLQMNLPGGTQVMQVTAKPTIAPFNYTRFLAVFALFAVIVLTGGWYLTSRVTAPLALFSDAAERLGRNVDGPPLPEDGPEEVRQAAAAFNRMQGRVKKFIADRTTMLAAISHDLRTPITRMRLRVEFVPDDTDRAKLISDLDEMEAMIAEALAFARNEAETEAVVAIDLQNLVEDIASDQRAVGAGVVVHPGTPANISGRPSALRRALTNLVRNAIVYGNKADIRIERRDDGFAIIVADEGPGIPDDELERVFTPFFRLEESRNKSSGGVGLGLSVARSTARAHGGDIILANRPEGGLAAILTLPFDKA
jgi:signal transduction histidine kinase